MLALGAPSVMPQPRCWAPRAATGMRRGGRVISPPTVTIHQVNVSWSRKFWVLNREQLDTHTRRREQRVFVKCSGLCRTVGV